MPNVMRMAWLRVCWLPAPLRVTAGHVVVTHHTSCPRCSRTLPKLSVDPKKACVCDKHALRTCHTKRFDLQKGLCDRNSPTCTLSQNGYGEALILRFGSQKKAGRGVWERGGRTQIPVSLRLSNSARSVFLSLPLSHGIVRGQCFRKRLRTVIMSQKWLWLYYP